MASIKNYVKELGIIFEAICDGFRQEVKLRQEMMLGFPKEKNKNFPLIYEGERGIVCILACYLRTTGFFVRVENWWHDGDEEVKIKRPDMDIWLRKTKTDFILQVKPIDLEKIKIKIKEDLDVLLKRNGKDKNNGLLLFGLAETDENHLEYKKKFKEMSTLIQHDDYFGEIGLKTIPFSHMKDSKLKSVTVGLWYRKDFKI